jgi:prevent-host-death family protein
VWAPGQIDVASRICLMKQHGIKREVGIRELHNQLSRYVRHVRDGGDVAVTVRGKRVARLVPIRREDPLEVLRQRGLIREPTGSKAKARGRRRAHSQGSVSELVAGQRR